MIRTSHRVSVALALALLFGACTSAAPADPPPRSHAPTADPPTPVTPAQVKVAFIEDLSSDEAEGRVLPALQAAELAFANAGLGGALTVAVDLVPLDTQGDPSQTTQVVDEIAADPEYVAAIIAPYVSDQTNLATALDAAGVPMLSLSSRQPALGEAGLTSWRRLVANRAQEAGALVAYVHALPAPSGEPCVARGPDPDDARWAHLLARTLGNATGPTIVVSAADAASSAAASIADSRCGVVVWTGSIEIAEALRIALTESGNDAVLIGGDELKDDAYPGVVGPAGDGTVAFCPCVDLSLATDLVAQRFIQDYQAEHGLAPGPYAAEAWDAAKMLVRALGSGAVRRDAVLAFLDGSGPFQGLANRYAFTSGGELIRSEAVVHAYRDRGGRWIELPPSP